MESKRVTRGERSCIYGRGRRAVMSKFAIRGVFIQLFLLTLAPRLARPQGSSACDLNRDGVVNILDIQLAVNMDLGLLTCTANIVGAGVCNVVVVQRVVNSTLGGTCVGDA